MAGFDIYAIAHRNTGSLATLKAFSEYKNAKQHIDNLAGDYREYEILTLEVREYDPREIMTWGIIYTYLEDFEQTIEIGNKIHEMWTKNPDVYLLDVINNLPEGQDTAAMVFQCLELLNNIK